MTPAEITLLVAYSIGIILNGIVFFVQKSKIDKLTGITDQIERYFKVFDVDSVEKLVKLKEMTFEQERKLIVNEASTKFTEEYMEKFGHKKIEKHLKKFESKMGEQFNELGWFVVDFLYHLPKDVREQLIKSEFPKSEKLIRENFEIMDNYQPTDLEIISQLDDLMVGNPGKAIPLNWIGENHSLGGRLRQLKEWGVVEVVNGGSEPLYKLTRSYNEQAPEDVRNLIDQINRDAE